MLYIKTALFNKSVHKKGPAMLRRGVSISYIECMYRESRLETSDRGTPTSNFDPLQVTAKI